MKAFEEIQFDLKAITQCLSGLISIHPVSVASHYRWVTSNCGVRYVLGDRCETISKTFSMSTDVVSDQALSSRLMHKPRREVQGVGAS